MSGSGVTGRPNPFVWTGEEAPQGVFVGAAEPDLRILGLPQGMRRRHMQVELVEAAGAAAQAWLGDVAAALKAAAGGAKPERFALAELAPDTRAMVEDLLGDGEVAGLVANDRLYQVSETLFPGLWRVIPDGAPEESWLEIADCPALVREAAEAVERDWLPLEHIVPPDGTMNVMGVLAEVRSRAQAWTPGADNHVMNFTLLPMTEADADFLAAVLDRGPVQLASGGYGSAKILATGLKRVWAVQFMNSMGVVILDTLEIGDLPSAACAQREDFEDSARRLAEILSGGLS